MKKEVLILIFEWIGEFLKLMVAGLSSILILDLIKILPVEFPEKGKFVGIIVLMLVVFSGVSITSKWILLRVRKI